MCSIPPHPIVQGYGAQLLEEPFRGLVGELVPYQLNPKTKAVRPPGEIHRFIRGLRLSVRLIYIIREVALPGSGVRADWGHVLSHDDRFCSRECDIILHRGHCWRWDGHEDPVMDFRFIRRESAISVISCKSFLRSLDQEQKQYCQDMKQFVSKVCLFAECCYTDRIEALQRDAISAGYERVWCLYTIDRRNTSVVRPREDMWHSFVEEMKAMARNAQTEAETSHPQPQSALARMAVVTT